MGKLVRDKIPDIIRNSGREPAVRAISGCQLEEALKEKLLEEALELKDPGNIKEEIIDVLEVVDALIAYYGYDRKELEELKNKKKEERGGFEKGYFLDK
jgi:predicted house-cleaning noncanonical NTP pyrophosphatase (MazG superfamily)